MVKHGSVSCLSYQERTTQSRCRPAAPQAILPHNPDVKIESYVLKQGHLAVFTRQQGLQGIQVAALGEGPIIPDRLPAWQRITFDEPAYEVSQGAAHVGGFTVVQRGASRGCLCYFAYHGAGGWAKGVIVDWQSPSGAREWTA